MTKNTDPRLIQLHTDDNIFVCGRTIHADEPIVMEGEPVTPPSAVQIGHKIARQDIGAGEKIFKYGVSIGSAKTDIRRGEHVHIHNMKSDYIPSHTRSGKSNDQIENPEVAS